MDDRPNSSRGTLIFDGDCGFCSTSIDLLKRYFPAVPSIIPYQWATLDSYGLTVSDTAERVWLVTPTHQYGGHRAVAVMLQHQPIAWMRALGWLSIVPPFSWAAAAAYALVARYRYRLPGGTPACRRQG